MTPALVVAGSLNMDFVVTVSRLPAPGETALGRDFQMIAGGKGANQAYAAARLGQPGLSVRMVGRVGYDWFGDHLKAGLAAAGVDVSAVHATRSHATGVALIWVDKDGQNSIVVAPGANHALAAEEMEGFRRSFRGARFALFQLETPVAAVRAGLRIARQEGASSLLDPAPAQPLDRELLGLVDILTPNESEALILLGRPPARLPAAEASEPARALRRMGARCVVLKLGDQGCYYDDGQRQIHQPAFSVAVRDSTAAGDTFNAAFAVALAEGKPIEEALRFANAAAALSVTRLGAQASAPARREVEEFLASAT